MQYHVLIYQFLVLLAGIDKCFLTDAVDHARNASGTFIDFLDCLIRKQCIFDTGIAEIGFNILFCLGQIQMGQNAGNINSLPDRRIVLEAQLGVP